MFIRKQNQILNVDSQQKTNLSTFTYNPNILTIINL